MPFKCSCNHFLSVCSAYAHGGLLKEKSLYMPFFTFWGLRLLRFNRAKLFVLLISIQKVYLSSIFFKLQISMIVWPIRAPTEPRAWTGSMSTRARVSLDSLDSTAKQVKCIDSRSGLGLNSIKNKYILYITIVPVVTKVELLC